MFCFLVCIFFLFACLTAGQSPSEGDTHEYVSLFHTQHKCPPITLQQNGVVDINHVNHLLPSTSAQFLSFEWRAVRGVASETRAASAFEVDQTSGNRQINLFE